VILATNACSPSTTTEQTTIRVAVLPILDSLPMYVADAQGYFAEAGLQIEFVPVNSAPERDQLMQSGQVDAMINELVSIMFYNQTEPQVVAVRFARTATSEYPVFRILASADSGIETVGQLAGVPIGVSEGTVIEYTTDRMLGRAGLTPDQIEIVAVPSIPDRMNLLASGQLSAANLPDPAASMAILNGAVPVIDDTTYPEISHSVITFSVEFIEQNEAAVESFLAAIERAVAEINDDKTAWDTLLSEQNLMPPPLLGVYALPDYPLASIPSQDQFMDALQWVLEEGLIDAQVEYATSVDGSYLP
jgi:NitT/TauT family transport system substrate-binding protein